MKDYNFFRELQNKRGLRIDNRSPLFWGIMALVLILVSSGGLAGYNILQGTGYSALREELATIQATPEYQRASAIQQRIGLLHTYDQHAGAALEKITQSSFLGTSFLDAFTALMPANASLRGARINRATAELTFTVPDRKAAAELFKNLEGSDLFVQSTLVSVSSQAGSAGYTAIINSVLKAGGTE